MLPPRRSYSHHPQVQGKTESYSKPKPKLVVKKLRQISVAPKLLLS